MKDYVSLMNRFLANQMVFYIKLHNLHWYVKGTAFFTLHTEYEKLYDNTTEILDEVAERMLIIGHSPIASLKEALDISTIKELAAKPIGGNDSVKVALSDLEQLSKDASELITLSAEAGDDVTADMFTGYAANYQKLIWMFKAYMS